MSKTITYLLAAVLLSTGMSWADTTDQSQAFSGQDLYLSGCRLTTHQLEQGRHLLSYEDNFIMTIGSNQFSSDRAIVWIDTIQTSYRGIDSRDYKVRVFLEGNVSVKKGATAKATPITENVIEKGECLMTGFTVTGEVFASSQVRQAGDPSSSETYQKAMSYIKPTSLMGKISREAQVPAYDLLASKVITKTETDEAREPFFSWFVPTALLEGVPEEAISEEPVDSEEEYSYPINIAGVWEPAPKIEKTTMADGTNAATVIGRFYLWQKLNEKGDILEFQADNAVIFYHGEDFKVGQETGDQELLATGAISAVYIQGDIVMTEGGRTIRADELYYNFDTKQALAVHAEMRNFDRDRGIPIYLKAEKLAGIADNVYCAKDITLTSDEFYVPQISAQASSIVVTDTSNIERRGKKVNKAKYDAVMRDVRLKAGKTTLFGWPKLRSNMERPELPIKKLSYGDDSTYGNAIETQWYLMRLLGLPEPEGVESVLDVDYYSKRGIGAGTEIDYEGDDYYGNVLGYIIDDSGKDRLGRSDSRKDVDPDEDLRGRFTFRHRQYLPYQWQLTLEGSYISDKNFLESFYRDEFYSGKEQETLIHLKRIRDNWAVAWLAKARINDFEDQVEELPTGQFHMAGQDLGGFLTYYGDLYGGRLRQRYADGSVNDLTGPSQQAFTYFETRQELDMPLCWGKTKYVPYVAGTFGFDDQDGFATGLNGQAVDPEDKVCLGEAGVRVSTMFWKIDPSVQSRLWDLNGIKHTVRPHLEAVMYEESEDAVAMRDMINLGLSQRWQTKRGPEDDLRIVDLMDLDIDATWVKDSGDDTAGPNHFIFNNPAIPMFKRRMTDEYGVQRNSIDARYNWRLSDTLVVMSDMNYDMQSGQVQQFDLGFTRYCWPNMSIYIGNRYLKRVIVEGDDPADDIYEKGSNSLNCGITYQFSPRYTLAFSQEYNFDYGKNVRSELALIRRYHRIYYGITLSTDQSLDRNAIVFSIWPEGVKELAVGSRKYYGLTRTSMYD